MQVVAAALMLGVVPKLPPAPLPARRVEALAAAAAALEAAAEPGQPGPSPAQVAELMKVVQAEETSLRVSEVGRCRLTLSDSH